MFSMEKQPKIRWNRPPSPPSSATRGQIVFGLRKRTGRFLKLSKSKVESNEQARVLQQKITRNAWSAEEKWFLYDYVHNHGGMQNVDWNDCCSAFSDKFGIIRTEKSCKNQFSRLNSVPQMTDTGVQTDISIRPSDAFVWRCIKAYEGEAVSLSDGNPCETDSSTLRNLLEQTASSSDSIVLGSSSSSTTKIPAISVQKTGSTSPDTSVPSTIFPTVDSNCTPSRLSHHFCFKCNKGFSDKESLDTHAETHREELMEYNCCECGKGFRKDEALALSQHMKTHVKKIHMCPECGLRFSMKRRLTTHMHTHIGKEWKPSFLTAGSEASPQQDIPIHIYEHQYAKPNIAEPILEVQSFSVLLARKRETPVESSVTHSDGEGSAMELPPPDMADIKDECMDSCVEDSVERPPVNDEEEERAQYSKHPSNATTAQRTYTGENPYICMYCDKRFSTRKNLQSHMYIHRGEKPHKCTECGKCYAQLCRLKIHTLSHAENPFLCSVCGKVYGYEGGLRRHILVQHTDLRPYVCSVCGKAFHLPNYLRIHVKVVHSGIKPHVCSICGKGFPMSKGLKGHMITHTSNRKLCSECGKSFGNMTVLKLHMLTHSGEMPHACTECGKGFVTSGRLKIHMMSHNGNMPHLCSYCGKGFIASARLKAHMLIHTDKTYLCSDCGKSFTTSNGLKAHMMIHTGKKPHKCSDCGKGFQLPYRLKEHIRSHTGEKPYMCSECGKGFASLRRLKSHMVSHSEVKRFVCTACGKCFKTSACLKKHAIIHTDARPYLCPDCGKSYRRLKELKKHRLTHPGNTPHQCSVCARGFTMKCDLSRHMLMHTGEKPFGCPDCDEVYGELGPQASPPESHGRKTSCVSYLQEGLHSKNCLKNTHDDPYRREALQVSSL